MAKTTKKTAAIIAEQISDERPVVVEETTDESLNDVLQESGAGATDAEVDVESPIGEDKAVEQSAKDLAENEVEEVEAVEEPVKKQHSAKVATPRKAPLHFKKYREAVKDLDLTQSYSVEGALEVVKKTSITKFDATVEAHIKLSVTNQRGVIHLPSGSGKEKKVMVVTADNIDAFITQVEAGKIDFDIVVAIPSVMPKLAKTAKILGPKGLMPNPKSGTVTEDVEKAKAEFASGRVEYKQDKGGVVHLGIGKVSMTPEQLKGNYLALVSALPQPKIQSIYLSSTMGPAVKVSL
ncbi:MAG: hypothetical protein WC773_00760 [Patescibacteria group bacterium]